MKGLAINTENQMQFKDFGEPLLDNLQKEVGGCIEVVHPKYLPEGLCMVIDDEGLLKGYAINSIASMDSNNFTASAIAAVVCLHNANAELKGTPKIGVTDVYVVWNCKTLQNNKALLATTVPDGMYYEATYNGDKKELYLDAYKKVQNVCIEDEG